MGRKLRYNLTSYLVAGRGITGRGLLLRAVSVVLTPLSKPDLLVLHNSCSLCPETNLFLQFLTRINMDRGVNLSQ